MTHGVGQDNLVLSHYDEYNLSNLKFALIGLGIILVGVITWMWIEGDRCYQVDDDEHPDYGQVCDEEMIFGQAVGIPIIIIGIIVIIYWFRLTSLRKSAMVAEASGDYEKAILLVTKLKDHKVIPSLTQKRNASPQPVQSPQVQQQYAQPQPQPQPQPATASSPQPSPNPTIHVNIQNVQPDRGAQNIHIHDSVVTDSDLL
jgi:hypothetical protein